MKSDGTIIFFAVFCALISINVFLSRSKPIPATVDHPIPSMLGPIVKIFTEGHYGSGVIVYKNDSKYRAITNFHVILAALRKPDVKVDGILGKVYHIPHPVWIESAEIGKRSKIVSGEIIAFDPAIDLALVQFESNDNLEVAEIISEELSSEISVLDEIYTAGCQLGYLPIINTGVVSGYDIKDGIPSIITSAPVSPGTSGGGVFIERNSKYYVLSIIRAMETDYERRLYPHYAVSIMPHVVREFLCLYSFEIDYLECEEW